MATDLQTLRERSLGAYEAGRRQRAMALALQNAAKVRTLGQVELLFTFAVSRWWLHDRHSRAEYWASAMVAAGVLLVLLTG